MSGAPFFAFEGLGFHGRCPTEDFSDSRFEDASVVIAPTLFAKYAKEGGAPGLVR